eukprot:184657-Rhodomonas_salina.3
MATNMPPEHGGESSPSGDEVSPWPTSAEEIEESERLADLVLTRPEPAKGWREASRDHHQAGEPPCTYT